TAVQTGRHVFAVGGYIFAGDELAADASLQRYLEILARDYFLEFLNRLAAQSLCLGPVRHDAERPDHVAGYVEIHPYQIFHTIVVKLVIEASVAAGNAL